jgi:hypothetical protein
MRFVPSSTQMYGSSETGCEFWPPMFGDVTFHVLPAFVDFTTSTWFVSLTSIDGK